MTSAPKSKKRRLPGWMVKAANYDDDGQNRINADSSESNGNGIVNSSKSNSHNTDKQSSSLSSRSKHLLHAGSDIIANDMPYLTFQGSVIYCNSFSDCSCFCEELISTVQDKDSKTPVGFDMEWPVSFKKDNSNKTALIQMCFSDKECYLFQVAAFMKFPKLLRDLIFNDKFILVGLNIEADLWKLDRDFDFRVKPLIDRGSVIDVGKLANEKLRSKERWDLNGLCKNVLRKRLDKNDEIRCGDWTDIPLSNTQKDYAAIDAFAGLKLYEVLMSDLPTR